jgi:hypothetical protein
MRKDELTAAGKNECIGDLAESWEENDAPSIFNAVYYRRN